MIDADPAATMRQRLAEQLTGKGLLAQPEVAAAFRAVPRHLFAPPGTSLEAAYADEALVTKRDADGKATSSISAPWLQAYMVQTAGLRPGARVLEIGSGGYNAALVAEIVGPTGAVTSIDIDTDVVGHARAALTRAGYLHVQVFPADAEHGYPARAPYDAIIVTVEANDIPPAWTAQLAPGGVLVVPLRIRANTRCLTLRRQDDHLTATAALQCGFVPMQGHGHSPTHRLSLLGEDAVLELDEATSLNPTAFGAALHQPRAEAWSPVALATDDNTAFESLHLWLASQPRPFAVLTVDRERTAGLLDPQDRFVCPTLLAPDSLAYLTVRRSDDSRWQLGAHGFGPHGTDLAQEMTDLIRIWDRHHRHTDDPHITIHRAGTQLSPSASPRLLVRRRHTVIAVAWPGRHS
ncbi:methyltransferase, FxLD system [Plantactinospora siamensis]|uniref:Protein-L-isoaspartate O-methyltransferase n=2 Tax=Plantactinospora siamensis TaxID=555372 RepID=A0ABV6P3A4_9ACTN